MLGLETLVGPRGLKLNPLLGGARGAPLLVGGQKRSCQFQATPAASVDLASRQKDIRINSPFPCHRRRSRLTKTAMARAFAAFSRSSFPECGTANSRGSSFRNGHPQHKRCKIQKRQGCLSRCGQPAVAGMYTDMSWHLGFKPHGVLERSWVPRVNFRGLFPVPIPKNSDHLEGVAGYHDYEVVSVQDLKRRKPHLMWLHSSWLLLVIVAMELEAEAQPRSHRQAPGRGRGSPVARRLWQFFWGTVMVAYARIKTHLLLVA